MSHFTVLVIGPDVEEQLAPYDENMEVEPYRRYVERTSWSFREFLKENPDLSDEELVARYNAKWGEGEDDEYFVDEKGIYSMSTYNPKSKWDWFTVGGRWMGYFKIKPEKIVELAQTGEAALGTPGVFDNGPRHDADIVHKGDVDVEGMRSASGDEAAEIWDLVHKIFGKLPEARGWQEILDECAPKDATGDREQELVDKARTIYHEQPRVKALTAHDSKQSKVPEEDRIYLGSVFGDVTDYQMPREQFVQNARFRALAPYAWVMDGEWHAPGDMGWWGMSSEQEDDKLAYQEHFNRFFDELPDDTILTLVDCHI